VFGAILLYAAWRTFRQHPGQEKENRAVKFLSQHLPVTQHTRDGAFVTKENGRYVVTPLLIALVAVELTDIVFAIDSVPAALSITRDRFIVMSSNAFAILGLRALYTVLAQTLKDLRYLHYGLAGVLAFAAFKLVNSAWLEIPAFISIGIIVVMIGVAVVVSLRARKRLAGPADGPVAPTPAG
jgi:tellurite resistance protein TerC